MTTDDAKILRLAREVLETEAEAVGALSRALDGDFVRACDVCLACQGRVVVTGMGKSGHVGGKIAATLASTGTPSFFVHPGEASHGDLGMITPTDVVLAISNSGETDEVLTILPLIKRLGVPLISMTGNRESTLGREADVHLTVAVAKEACPMNLAPTASTTAALAMGDALAVALLEARGFTETDFARSHPGGSLGRRLLIRARDLMRRDQEIPQVRLGTSLGEALLEISAKGLGMTTVTDDSGAVVGVFTDGDLRRTMDQGLDVHSTRIDQVMTPGGRRIQADELAAEGVKLMEEHAITALLVYEGESLVGILHMHDLLRARVI